MATPKPIFADQAYYAQPKEAEPLRHTSDRPGAATIIPATGNAKADVVKAGVASGPVLIECGTAAIAAEIRSEINLAFRMKQISSLDVARIRLSVTDAAGPAPQPEPRSSPLPPPGIRPMPAPKSEDVLPASPAVQLTPRDGFDQPLSVDQIGRLSETGQHAPPDTLDDSSGVVIDGGHELPVDPLDV